MEAQKYKRVLIKISGEALAGDKHFGLNFDVIGPVCDVIKKCNEEGCEIGIVVGGGNFWRGVKTQFGYHLIKVEDKKEAGESNLEEVKDQIRAELSQKKQEEAYRAKVDELKKKYMD